MPKKPSPRMGRCWRLDGFLRSDGGLTPLGILFMEARAQRNFSTTKDVELRGLSRCIPSHRARRLALLVGVCASYVQCRPSVLWQDRFTHGSAERCFQRRSYSNTTDAWLVVSFLALHSQLALRRGSGCSDSLASLTVFPLGCLAGRVSLRARVPVGRA